MFLSVINYNFQIIGPHDDEIVRIKEAEPQPREEYWDLSQLRSSPLFHSADVVIEPYFEVEKSLNFHKYAHHCSII